MGLWETKVNRRAFTKVVAAGASVAALSPIAAIEDQRLNSLAKETDSSRNITFQPGIHPTTDAQFQEIWDKFYKQGNIRPSTWNQEVAQRMGKVSIIGIDGSSPSDTPSDDEKVFAWLSLPDRPSQIASDGKRILLLRGDIFYSNILDSFPTADYKRIKESVFENLAKRDTRTGTISSEELAIYAKEAGVVALAVVSANLLLAKALQRPKALDEQPTGFSRRSLLKTGVSLGAATVLTMAGVTKLFNFAVPAATNASSDGLRKFFETMAEAPPLDLHDQESLWLNARTALICAKLEDAMDDLGLPLDAKAAIVMGDAHLIGANDLLKSRQVREKLIQEYAKLMIDLVKQMVGNTVDEETIKISVIEQLARYDVLEITDPGTKGDIDKTFANNIGQYVQQLQSTHWGSRQVTQALQSLY